MKFDGMRFWRWMGIWLLTMFVSGGYEAIARTIPYEPAHAHSSTHKRPKGAHARGIPDDWTNRGNGGGTKHHGNNGNGTHNDDWNATGGSTSGGRGGRSGKGTHSDDWDATGGGGTGKVKKGGNGTHGDNWTSTNAARIPHQRKNGPTAPPSSERGPN